MAILIKNDKNKTRRVKPYLLKLVDDIQVAPEKPEIEHHDEKANKATNRYVRRQRKLQPEKEKVNKEGQVIMKERDLPKQERRDKKVYPKVGDRVKALFNVGDKQEYFEGKVLKVNPTTYHVLFDDGDKLYMKKNEVILI